MAEGVSSRFCRHATKDENSGTEKIYTKQTDWSKVALFGTVGFFYWYWLVLGALIATNGGPGIPDFLPLSPGWPPSEEDLKPVLEDSQHFFYLSELLGKTDTVYVQPVRLAAFNLVEAWMVAFLPALWKDPKRLPRPVLLVLWALLGINLTNAFLAPYLCYTELSSNVSETSHRPFPKNRLVSLLFGSITTAVVWFAIIQSAAVATQDDWTNFGDLIQTDRSYLAFGVDLILFSLFQPLVLQRAGGDEYELKTSDYIPFFGLAIWLFRPEESME